MGFLRSDSLNCCHTAFFVIGDINSRWGGNVNELLNALFSHLAVKILSPTLTGQGQKAVFSQLMRVREWLGGGGADGRAVVEFVLEIEEEVPDLFSIHAEQLAGVADGVILHVDERGQLVHVEFLEAVVHI